jgi:hypothetical protein
MENLAVHLALHGALVLAVILVAGLLLYRAILRDGNVPGWQLALRDFGVPSCSMTDSRTS